MATNFWNATFREADETDMSHGLPVIIVARWALVVCGAVFALWNASDMIQLQVSVLAVIALAVANFFLHVEVAKKRQVDKRIIYGLSAADLVVVTAVLASGAEFPADPYVFYLPALAAIAVTFSTGITAAYTAATAFVYTMFSSVATAVEGAAGDESGIAALVAHIVVLVAVPFCGNVYWRLERDRRERSEQADEIKSEIINSGDRSTGAAATFGQRPVEAHDA